MFHFIFKSLNLKLIINLIKSLNYLKILKHPTLPLLVNSGMFSYNFYDLKFCVQSFVLYDFSTLRLHKFDFAQIVQIS